MLVGLTGGIGSGKTIVSKVFETMGCFIYNSDEKAKALYNNSNIKKNVIELLGTESYLNEHEINKEYISKKVFNYPELLQKLNQIIHPAVKEDFINFKNKLPEKSIIVKETALLFEAGINKDLDYTILVTAPIDIKIKRVMSRNHISKEEVEKRMSSQWSDEQKKNLANIVITNDESLALIPQVISIIEKLKNA
ncbi:MAG: dephospho-CoA kinase [Bacteroidia bacterium]|nr:dephospho-CoA kinase [Bacteroidia bacterium]